MIPNPDLDCAVFAGDRLIARGAPRAVLPAMKAACEAGEAVLAFDLATGRTVEFDLRGDLETALGRLPEAEIEPKKGPGRPKGSANKGAEE